MPLKVNCSFCGKEIEPGTGVMYVRNDNQRYYFCSHKCEKNMLKLGRKARNLKWTESYEKGPTPPQPEEKEEEPDSDESSEEDEDEESED